MKKLFILFLAGCAAATQVKDPEFPLKVQACDNSASCRALYEQVNVQLSGKNCRISDCRELIANKNAAQRKFELMVQQEERTASFVALQTERLRRERQVQQDIHDKEEKRDADRMKREFCDNSQASRNKANADFAQYSEIYNSNKIWAQRNCRKIQTTKQACAFSPEANTTVCRKEIQSEHVQCSSNKRPSKYDGTRLNDADIVDNNFAADPEMAEQLTEEKSKADKQEAECRDL